MRIAACLSVQSVAARERMLHRHETPIGMKYLRTGNRCGHQPDSPRWFDPPASHRQRPRILLKLAEKVRGYYQQPAATIPSLNLANGSERQQRSERREACIQLLEAMIHYLDLVTLRVGFPRSDGSFQNLTLEFLAHISRLGERRAERAVADLVKAGIISIKHRYEKQEDGNYRGLAAVRSVSQDLFVCLGLGAWLRHERNKAKARQKKREDQCAGLGRSKLTLFLASTRHVRPRRREVNGQRNRTAQLRELMLAYPDRPIEELFSLLRAPPESLRTETDSNRVTPH